MPSSCDRCGKDFYIPIFTVLSRGRRMLQYFKRERVCFECLKPDDDVIQTLNNPKKVSAA
jgi:hypothetical protein